MKTCLIPKWKIDSPESREVFEVLRTYVYIEENREVFIVCFDKEVDIERLKERYPEIKKLLE